MGSGEARGSVVDAARGSCSCSSPARTAAPQSGCRAAPRSCAAPDGRLPSRLIAAQPPPKVSLQEGRILGSVSLFQGQLAELSANHPVRTRS